MITKSAISAGQQKCIAAGWVVSFSAAFLLGLSGYLFEPLVNEFYSILQIAAYLFCFSLGTIFLPKRKSRHLVSEQFLFILLLNFLVFFLLPRPVLIHCMIPLLFLAAGRITGQLRRKVISPRHFTLACAGGAAAGMLILYLLDLRISSGQRQTLFLIFLFPLVFLPLRLNWDPKNSRWINVLLTAGWLLLPLQFFLHPDASEEVMRSIGNHFRAESVPFGGETEIKPASVVQAMLQPNRRNLKILLIGDSVPIVRLLSAIPLTRKLSNLSLTAGTDIYRKLNAESDDFDLIVLLLPLPQSLYAERLYSIRFYQILKDHLADDGVLTVWLPEELLSYNKNHLNEVYGSAGSALSKVFSQVKPSCSDPLVLLCGGNDLTDSPSELNDRAEKLLPDSNLLPEKIFLMGTSEEQEEQERFLRSKIFQSGGQDERMCSLLWHSIRSHPLLDRTILGGVMDSLRGQLLCLLAILVAAGIILRYFFSGGHVNKRNWMTWENGIYTGLVVMLFLIPYQQYTGRLSRDWILLIGFFLLAGTCGMLLSAPAHHFPLLMKLLLGLTLLLPLCGSAFLQGYSPEPLIFYAAMGYIGLTAGAVYADIHAEVPVIPAGLAAGLVLGIIFFWLPGGTFFAMVLAVLVRIPPVSSEFLRK